MPRESLRITISSDDAAKKAPFIYLGLSRSCRAIYLGETRSSTGVIGRIAQHVSETSSNTFKQRVCAISKSDDITLRDIHFIAVQLSGYRGFWLDSSEYRRAVEYLVHCELLNFLSEAKISLCLTSRVNANGYCNSVTVRRESEIVARSMFQALREIL